MKHLKLYESNSIDRDLQDILNIASDYGYKVESKEKRRSSGSVDSDYSMDDYPPYICISISPLDKPLDKKMLSNIIDRISELYDHVEFSSSVIEINRYRLLTTGGVPSKVFGNDITGAIFGDIDRDSDVNKILDASYMDKMVDFYIPT